MLINLVPLKHGRTGIAVECRVFVIVFVDWEERWKLYLLIECKRSITVSIQSVLLSITHELQR